MKCRSTEGLCWTRTAERQASRMRRLYLESVLRQPVEFFDAASSSSQATTFRVISTISDDADTIQDFLAEKLPNVLANMTLFFGALVVSFVFAWQLALAGLPFTLLFVVPSVVLGKRMAAAAGAARAAYEEAGGVAEQAVSSIRTVAAYGGERRTMARFDGALARSTALGIRQGLVKGAVIGSVGVMFAVWSFLSWLGSVLVIHGNAQGGHVFVASICIVLAGMSVMMALPNLRYFVDAATAAARMREMIDKLPPPPPTIKKGGLGTNEQQHVKGQIVFRDVHFSYPSRPDTKVLNGVSLTIPEGATVGLVGGSGSGKSTVISLLQRFYSPNKGEILLDGRDVGAVDVEWLRGQMGLVSQEPVLFGTSVRENILFGNEAASLKQVVVAAKMANAHEFITKLPNGYETNVGQLGTQLSGGQKQRIAIARALVRDPRILLLDEATSALDSESERAVQDALDRASVGRTTVVVAHRLSTLRKADTIAVLDAGRVVEQGTHDELLGTDGGVYANMQKASSAAAPRAEQQRHRVVEVEADDESSRVSFRSVEIMSVASSFHPSPVPSFRSAEYSVIDGQDEKRARNNKPSQLRLLKMNRPEWKQALLGCAGAVVFGAVMPLYSYSLGSLPEVYFLGDDGLIRSKTRLYSLVFFGIAIVCIVANIVQHYNFAVMGERLTERVRSQMLAKILSFEMGWFDLDSNSSAAISARLATQATKLRSLVGDRMSLLVQAGANAALGFSLSLSVSWRLALVMMAMQPLIIASFYFKKVLMTSASRKARKAQARGSQLAGEAVANHRTVTAFSSQRRVLELYAAAQAGPRRDGRAQSWVSGSCLSLCQFSNTGSMALALWYGGRLMAAGLATPTHVFQVFFMLMTMGRVIADAGSLTSDLAQGGDAARAVLDTLDRDPLIQDDDDHDGGIDEGNNNGRKNSKKKEIVKGAIEFRDVGFSYPTRPEAAVLDGFSLEIGAGKTVALVGPSGSGKSTVIALIERFYDAQRGAVMVDGRDIRSFGLAHLRSRIALVSQEPTLFSGTIRDNIMYGDERATEDEVVNAAKLANAHDFISGMEGGYDARVGERGAQLSGGQRQRVALARAILKNARILLLDEATSALDTVSERLVQDAVDRMLQGRTCVVVAHRLSTVQKSDMIAVVKNGKVVERGRHGELIAAGRGGMYYNLIKLQHGASPSPSPMM
ncbi:hypothetical protein PR202_gb15259 [Eleusine coracana subsp. coracana]|uniref:Uncharacterized protein n=1 Tax=Eleusine coracana subsp. coracana TaxID=191504 RepID=A0AAV5EV27_ELECO|nr:hypothetical protein PR202_gb15259 [Eleusine coracana subsp. coracana]